MGIYVLVTDFSGWTGGPGTSTLIFRGKNEGDTVGSQAAADAAAVMTRAFWGGVGGIVATGILGQVRSPVIARNPVTGDGVGEFSVESAPLSFGGLGDQLPAASSIVVGWRTSLPTRRGRGRSFIPPATEAANDANGTPTAAAIASVNSAANQLIADSAASLVAELVVWHRPPPPPLPPGPGFTTVVQTHRVRDTWGSLRSRRD